MRVRYGWPMIWFLTPPGRNGVRSLVPALGFALSLVGCGSSTPQTGVPAFVGEASLRLQTIPSAFTSSWRFSPPEPARGSNAAEITLTDHDGLPLAGWKVSVVPWMPAHAHGTSVVAAVEEVSGGVYVVQPLYLYMGGHWELRTTFEPVFPATSAGPLGGAGTTAGEVVSSETVVPALDIR